MKRKILLALALVLSCGLPSFAASSPPWLPSADAVSNLLDAIHAESDRKVNGQILVGWLKPGINPGWKHCWRPKNEAFSWLPPANPSLSLRNRVQDCPNPNVWELDGWGLKRPGCGTRNPRKKEAIYEKDQHDEPDSPGVEARWRSA